MQLVHGLQLLASLPKIDMPTQIMLCILALHGISNRSFDLSKMDENLAWIQLVSCPPTFACITLWPRGRCSRATLGAAFCKALSRQCRTTIPRCNMLASKRRSRQPASRGSASQAAAILECIVPTVKPRPLALPQCANSSTQDRFVSCLLWHRYWFG